MIPEVLVLPSRWGGGVRMGFRWGNLFGRTPSEYCIPTKFPIAKKKATPFYKCTTSENIADPSTYPRPPLVGNVSVYFGLTMLWVNLDRKIRFRSQNPVLAGLSWERPGLAGFGRQKAG